MYNKEIKITILEKIKKALRNQKLKTVRYAISANGSTVYVLDKDAARKKAQNLAKLILEKNYLNTSYEYLENISD